MPIPCSLSIIAQNQGQIEGSDENSNREGSIIIQSVEHCVEIPSDSRGVSSGRRVHRALQVTKEIDKSSPMLMQALCTGEVLTEVTLGWYRIDETGSEELYYCMHLQNALISKIKPWLPNAMNASNSGFRHMEDVCFIYEKIRWTWELDGIEFEDNWGDSEE